jgi:hypothetical protein
VSLRRELIGASNEAYVGARVVSGHLTQNLVKLMHHYARPYLGYHAAQHLPYSDAS